MFKFKIIDKAKKTQKNIIRKKLLLYFLISSVLVNAISLFTYNNTRVLSREMNEIFTNDILLTNLNDTLDSVETSLKSYLTTSHSSDLYNYLSASNKFRNMVLNLKTTLTNDESDLLFIDIKNMALTYLQDTEFALQEKRGRDITGYTDEFNEATRIYNYTDEYIDKLKIYEFKENNTYYLKLSDELGTLQEFNMIIMIVAMVINFILIILFSYSISEPIIRLSRAASEIARGNYNIPEVKVRSNDELKTLAVSFNHMAESIRKQLVEIHEKAEIENCLKEQEMQNLKMKSMLNEAELRSLQAQIDPHFMFNTLNAAMQLSMFEGADRTQLFLENFSELLRYNLGNMSIPSTLYNEIGNIENYIYLLNERYGNKIKFIKNIENDVPDAEIPRMTLQPIVENSFIHGINEFDSGGFISVNASKTDRQVFVEIEDNGCGMSGEMIRKILSVGGQNVKNSKDAEGKKNPSIGLKNVISRLMLFYHTEDSSDVIEITSAIDIGTKVTVKLPIARQEDGNV